MSRVIVVGSINVDLVCRTDRQPRPGETVAGSDFATHPGGKGANQAVAAVRSGAPTTLVGRVGDDAFGREQRDFLSDQGIDVARVRPSPGDSTGVASIVVDHDGENSIVVVPGANGRVSEVDFDLDVGPGDVVACQFEIPLPVVAAVLGRARAAGATTVLNPAPAHAWPRGDLERADVLVVNESELAFFAERPEPDPAAPEEVRACLRELRTRPTQAVVATLGGFGLLALVGDDEIRLPAHPAVVVDTTGAGDTFVGAVAAALALGQPLAEALARANLAASICVERPGAGPSIPTADEVERRRRSGPLERPAG